MAEQYRINVYNEDKDVIARVRYNANLDYWDGSNWTNGGVGKHKGLTKLKDGRYVLIHGTQWQGEKDFGEIISKEQALQEILKSQSLELLETKKFKELKGLYEERLSEEVDDDLVEEEM